MARNAGPYGHWMLPLLQALHALSFAATHLGSMHFLARVAPAGRGATAQGDFAADMLTALQSATPLGRAADHLPLPTLPAQLARRRLALPAQH